ncbi:MAG: exo-alpha-sialidase, partial [Verrucomicrobiales bacterium]|nr:exo-alpha-sialidase [Verrucomicrobiales bacterium]
MHRFSSRSIARSLLALLLVACALESTSLAADIEVERIFGPEIRTGDYKHPSSITELDQGDLYLAYYGGAGEYATETHVYGSRLKKGSKRWSRPTRIAGSPFYSMGNPVLWQAPDRVLWLFYVVRPGATWSTSRIAAKISRDHGASWSDSFVVSWEAGMMVRSRPILLSDGAYLLPVYHETGSDPDRT